EIGHKIGGLALMRRNQFGRATGVGSRKIKIVIRCCLDLNEHHPFAARRNTLYRESAWVTEPHFPREIGHLVAIEVNETFVTLVRAHVEMLVILAPAEKGGAVSLSGCDVFHAARLVAHEQ